MDRSIQHRFLRFSRKSFLGTLIGAASLFFAAMSAQAAVSVDDIWVDGARRQTLRGGTLVIYLELSHDVTSVTGQPRLRLKNISNLAGGSSEHLAMFDSYDANELKFTYQIQAGDFTDGDVGVDISRLEVPTGARILTQGGELQNGAYVPSLIEDGGYKITISTIYFDGFTTEETMSAEKAQVDKQSTYRIYVGGAVNNQINFEVSFECDDDSAVVLVKYQDDSSGEELHVGEIYDATTRATGGSMTLYVTPKRTTSDEITITIRPSNAGGNHDADLVIHINKVTAQVTTIESISVATPDNKTYGYGETIHINVYFSSEVQSVSGTPILGLNVENQNNDPYYSSNNPYRNYAIYDPTGSSSNMLSFTYAVKAGDYVKDLDATELNPPGSSATINFRGGRFDYVTPTGDDPRSLASNSDVNIQTIVFQDYATATPNISMVEDEEKGLVITRGGAVGMAQRLTVSSFDPDIGAAMQSGDKITYPSSFTIAANADRAELAITAVEAGVQCLRLHPVGYSGTNGDLVATITVTPSPVPRMVRINSSVREIEGSEPFTAQISLSRAPKERITVTVSSSNTSKLRIEGVDGSVGTLRNGDAVITFAAGQTGPYTVTMRPLDGDRYGGNVTLTATADKTYSSASQRISVLNANPQISVSLDENGDWVVTGFSAMSPGNISWSVNDPSAADRAGSITNRIDWGDGNVETLVNVTAASHTYDEPRGDAEAGTGGYIITLYVYDKDGGQAYAQGRIIVTSPITVLLSEFKRQEGHTGRNSYGSDQTGQKMQGMGEGSIAYRVGSQPFTTAYRTVISPNYNWAAYFRRAKQSVVFRGEPATFASTHPATGTTATFDSFFHVWVGEDFTDTGTATNPNYHAATSAIAINGDEEDAIVVGGVFSREYYPEDNCPDIDFDQLPDEWENLAWPGTYAFEDIGGSDGRPYGCNDNPDGDCFPACVVGIEENGSFIVSGSDYGATGGLPFANVYEVRGTHWGLNAKYSDCVEPQDEPHCGSYDASGNFTDDDNKAFYGTDPTMADTDNDGLTDGWEYFFWRQASFSAMPVGLRRNGNGSVSQIANAEIAAMFNPCVSSDHKVLDIDGDGLSNNEEFLRGTSPILWDTDGDGLADGYYEPVQTITLDPAGGTVSPDSIVRNYGEVYGELPVPVKKGYAFRSWTLYGNAVSAVSTVSCITNHTLVATWHANAIPTIEDLLEAAIDGANFADDGVKEAIGGDFTKYAEFRAWAQTIPGGEDAVVASERAAISYLLGTDTLIANDIESDDVHITGFSIDHGAENDGGEMQFSFEITIDGVEIGSSDAIGMASLKENLRKAIGIEGSARLDGEFSSENIELTFDAPVDGKARFTATPPPDAGESFFMRANVK